MEDSNRLKNRLKRAMANQRPVGPFPKIPLRQGAAGECRVPTSRTQINREEMFREKIALLNQPTLGLK